MKKFSFILFIFTISAVLTINCSKDSGGLTIKKGILMIGIEIGFPPMEYYGGPDGVTPMGFDVEMGKAIAAKLGLEAEFIDTSWTGIFSGVETQRYDCIMSSVTITPERLKAHNLSKPYMGNSMAIVTLKSSDIQPKSPQELAGLGVAYQAETTSKFFMTKLVNEGLKYTPFEYDKFIRCFDELKLGRVDVIVTDSVITLSYINSPDSLYQITWLGEPDEYFGICMKGGNDKLTEAIDNALDELYEEGVMRKLALDILTVDMVSFVRQ